MLVFLIDNKFAMFAGRVFQQTVGIPMGTNCAPHSISDHCFDDLTNYRQNCYSSIVDGIVFASDVKRCTLSYFASVSSSETMDR
jgi:hypothetical protein